MKEREPMAHRFWTCELCGDRLSGDKGTTVDPETGTRERARQCPRCGEFAEVVNLSKHRAEERTGFLVNGKYYLTAAEATAAFLAAGGVLPVE